MIFRSAIVTVTIVLASLCSTTTSKLIDAPWNTNSPTSAPGLDWTPPNSTSTGIPGDEKRTLKLLIIASANPESIDFAMYVSRRYWGGAAFAIEDVQQGTEYGEWDISALSDFNFEVAYVPVATTGNETTIVDGETVTVEHTSANFDLSMQTAADHIHDPNLIGIMCPPDDIITPAIAALAYMSGVPVFTITAPDTNLAFSNKISMAPTADLEIDVMMSLIVEYGWTKVGIVYLESFNSFSYAFGLKAAEAGVQLLKYVITNDLVIDDVIDQLEQDRVKIIVFHNGPSEAYYAFTSLANYVDDSHVILTTSLFNATYVARHDACDDCLRGITSIIDVYNDNDDIAHYNKRAITMNDNGGYGIDVFYSYTGVSDSEYVVYDAWMAIFDYYKPVADRLRAGESVHEVTKDLDRVGSNVNLRGLSSHIRFDGAGNIVKDFNVLNYQSYGKATSVIGTFSAADMTLDLYGSTIFADGTTVTPPDRDPDVIREISNIHITMSLLMFTVSTIIAVFLMSMVIMRRNEKNIRSHGYAFIISSILGACLGSLAIVVGGMMLEDSNKCYIENFLIGMSFQLVFGSLLIKNWRIWKIQKSIDLSTQITAIDLFVRLFVIALPEIIVMLVKVGVSDQSVELVAIEGTYNEYRYACTSAGEPWWTISINAYRLIIAGACTYFAVKTQSFKKEFQESVYVIYFTLWTVPLIICLVVVLSLVKDYVSGVYLIKYLFIDVGVIMFTLCLVVPIIKKANRSLASKDKKTIRSSDRTGQGTRRDGTTHWSSRSDNGTTKRDTHDSTQPSTQGSTEMAKSKMRSGANDDGVEGSVSTLISQSDESLSYSTRNLETKYRSDSNNDSDLGMVGGRGMGDDSDLSDGSAISLSVGGEGKMKANGKKTNDKLTIKVNK